MTAAGRQLDRTALFAVPRTLCCCFSSSRSSTGSSFRSSRRRAAGSPNCLRFFSQPFLYDTIATTLWVAIPTTLVNVGLARWKPGVLSRMSTR
jgi:hypothetical protein